MEGNDPLDLEKLAESVPEHGLDLALGNARSIDKLLADPGIMQKFVRATKNAPLDAIEDAIVAPAYAAILWKFRAAALNGDTDTTRAIKTFLDWAKPIVNRPKREKRQPNQGAAAFGPREPGNDDPEKA